MNEPLAHTAVFTQCAEGDRAAWRDLHRTYYPTVFAFLRALGVEGSDLDDGCQEVFVLLLRKIGQFERRSDFRTWLYRLCATQARRLRRRASMMSKITWLFGSSSPGEPASGLEWDDAVAFRRVEKALAVLSPKLRLVLVLREFEGLDVDAVATIANCPEATVWTRLHYARKQFEASLREETE